MYYIHNNINYGANNCCESFNLAYTTLHIQIAFLFIIRKNLKFTIKKLNMLFYGIDLNNYLNSISIDQLKSTNDGCKISTFDKSLHYNVKNDYISHLLFKITKEFNCHNVLDIYKEYEKIICVFHQYKCNNIKTLDNLVSSFSTVIDEIFLDGINFGRIIALISFSTFVIQRLIFHDLVDFINEIIKYTNKYYQNYLEQWIDSNGGLVIVFFD
ncbi:hypothetical protein A3Q56_06132 [Intoshia linei]|uniref:Bcl-2 Bcl-2 homology region 1-3 domain-containing protein n=1 Tax=Intoshia linei TaxID=1819745 RepID=A0A177AXB5_9BILA|nr:hypothetical protein A3Q56_06132 [Intoshia linei]